MSTDSTTETPTTGSSDSGASATDDPDREELLARIDLLEEENRRLREEYARARRSQYRRTALGLAGIGVIAVLGGLVFPTSRTVLFALGAIGLFGALLTYYLTPERFVAATVGEGVYDAVAHNGEAIVSELGLTDDRTYIPVDDPTRPATLFVPQQESVELPSEADLASVFVVPEDDRGRGVSLHPVGAALFDEFERALAGPLADAPGPLADQLADALLHEFELAGSVTPEVDDDGAGVTVGITDSTVGDVDRFDHPIASFLAVGLAVGLERPVELDVLEADDRADYLVTCSWDAAHDSEGRNPDS